MSSAVEAFTKDINTDSVGDDVVGITTTSSPTLSEFISLVNKDQISTVSFKGDGFTIDGTMNDGSSFTTTRPI